MDKSNWVRKTPLILIAEDDPITRRLLRQLMEKQGYQVLESTNGHECLELYQNHRPDIILLDVMMPLMDGFVCCQQLRLLQKQETEVFASELDLDSSLDQIQHILADIEQLPILMLTSLSDTEYVEQAYAAGATDFITKPINLAVLRRRVQHLLAQSLLYQELKLANYRLHKLATIDSLTQLANRRRFDRYLQQQWRFMFRQNSPLSLILCDVDFFKFYNDTYGHQAGDRCLQQVAETVSTQAQRPLDLVARYGGEELAVILPITNLNGAFVVAERMREALAKRQIPHEASPISDYVTASFGVASLIPDDYRSEAQLVTAADRALYQAKEKGRACVVF